MLPPSLHPEDGGSLVSEMLVSYHNTSWHHNQEDLNLVLAKVFSPFLIWSFYLHIIN